MAKYKHKLILTFFWVMAVLVSGLYYFQHPFLAYIKPFIIPLLIAYLLLNDLLIGKPAYKMYFYIGLLFAFFGDVFLIFVTDTFFLTGMICFMIMMICFSIYFYRFYTWSMKNIIPLVVKALILILISIQIFFFLDQNLGQYRIPVMVYEFFITVLCFIILNCYANLSMRPLVIRYFLPAISIFILQNMLIVYDKFHPGGIGDNNGLTMILYCIAQFLFVKGFAKNHEKDHA